MSSSGILTLCGTCNHRLYGGTYRLHHQGDKNRRASVLRLLVTANVVPSSTILVTLIMEAINTSETSVLTRVARCHIPDYGILHSQRPENLKSYIALTGGAL
jgi:hypothetical protein